MEQYKTCTSCKQTKALVEFHNSKSGRLGKKAKCKPCNNAAASTYQRQNKEKTYNRIHQWRKDNPDKVAVYSRKARIKRKDVDREYRKVYYQNNIDKKRIYSRKYAEEFPEKLRAKGRRWRKANPDKLRRYSSERRSRKNLASIYKITDKEVARIMSADCMYCGSRGGTIDHVIPLIRGGLHGVGNLVSACERCNKSKADKFITEWKKVRGW